MVAVAARMESNSLPDGTKEVSGTELVKGCIERIRAAATLPSLSRSIADLVQLLDVHSNPQAYRHCQGEAARWGANDVLVSRLESSTLGEGMHANIWDALGALVFNHAELQKKLVFSDVFLECMRVQLLPGHQLLELFAAMRCLISVAPCCEVHARLAPLLPSIANIATGSHGFGATAMLAVETLVNVSSNADLRPLVALAFTSESLKAMVSHVNSSQRKDNEFAVAMLLANLGSHSTEDGRGCLGSALDWVPFKDLKVFEELAAALDAALEQRDWPPGSNAFHSTHRLACLASALAASPMMQTAYPMQLANLVRPLVGVVAAGGDAASVACTGLQELANSPSNFGAICGDASLMETLVELRDYDGLASAVSLLSYLDEYKEKVVICGGGVLWRPIELLARIADQHKLAEWRLPVVKPEVVRNHVQKEVKELSEEVDISGHRCSELLGILPKLPTKRLREAMTLWGEARFTDAEDVERCLSRLVDYCEGGGCLGAGIKSNAPECTTRKLRMVAKLLAGQDSSTKLPVLLLLAAHGGVCNVQKEVGIDAAYAQLTRTYSAHADRTCFEACVLRLLRDKREQVVEQLSVEHCVQTKWGINTHYIVPFRNLLSEAVGIRSIPDQNAVPMAEESAVQAHSRFWNLYSLEAILTEVGAALNDLPRRIPYEVFLTWLKDNTPPGADAYSFLSASFDVQGHVHRATLEYAMCCMGVLRSPTVLNSGPCALKVQIGPQECYGLDAFLLLAKRWGFEVDPDKCIRVLTELYQAPLQLNDATLDPDALGNLRQLLTVTEGELSHAPTRASPAEDWLLAGAFMQLHMTPTLPQGELSPELLMHFPRVRDLVYATQQHLMEE